MELNNEIIPEVNYTSKPLSDTEKGLLKFLTGYTKISPALNKALPAVVFGFGTIANLLLIVYLIRSKRYQIPVFTLLTSLACCDLATSFWAVVIGNLIWPFIITEKKEAICRMTGSLASVSFKASICHMVLLSAVRYYQISYPLKANTVVTTRWMLRNCLLVWLLCALVSIPYAILFAPYPIEFEGKTVYVCHLHANQEIKELVYIFFVFLGPCFLVATLHLLKQRKMSKDSELTQQERRSTSSNIVYAIIVMFIVTMLPRVSHSSYHAIFGMPLQEYHLALWVYLLHFSYLNSVVNPFFYLICSNEIRHDIAKVLFGKDSHK